MVLEVAGPSRYTWVWCWPFLEAIRWLRRCCWEEWGSQHEACLSELDQTEWLRHDINAKCTYNWLTHWMNREGNWRNTALACKNTCRGYIITSGTQGHIRDWHAVLGLLHSTIQQHSHSGWIWHGCCGNKNVLRQGSGKLAVSSMRREPENGYSSCSRQRFRVQGHMVKFIPFSDFFIVDTVGNNGCLVHMATLHFLCSAVWSCWCSCLC